MTSGCLHAEGEIMGACILVLKIVDALMPPPLPTRQPARLYIGNLAVKNAFRRQGVATALLRQCERIGELLSYNRCCALDLAAK
jgi:ribosomal protein S18 acetylase RimI-like enzyme